MFKLVLVPPLSVLFIFVFLFPLIIEHKVNVLVNDIMKREGIGGVDVFKFEKVKTFGGFTSMVFFVFAPAMVFQLCCSLY